MSEPFVLDHWIAGKPHAAQKYVDVHSPATRAVVSRRGEGTTEDVDLAVSSASNAWPAWRAFDVKQRGRLLHAIGEAIRDRKTELMERDVAETGKPEALAAAEVEGSAAYFEYYAGLVNLTVGDVIDVGPTQYAYSRREPYGVVGVITPWNVPLGQIARGVAPALATGNTAVTKPSEFTSASSILLAEIASEAGLPEGVFNVVLGDGPTVGASLVGHPEVRKVAFTGSVPGGRAVAEVAAERLIPATLELGGKSANIIFDDADLDVAVDKAVGAFVLNTGQICSAGTRLLVQRSVYDEVVERLTERVAALRPGEDLGPLITPAQYEKVRDFLNRAHDEGACAAVGGQVPAPAAEDQGYFVTPTVFVDVDNSQRIAREEAFGPILVVIAFEDESDAIRIANDSEYGLVAAVWSRDIGRALRVAHAVEAGQVSVNAWAVAHFQLPFGGFKNSGYGREKGIEAMHHYTHTKAVVVDIAP